MVATAEMILERRAGHFDPSTFRDRYQEALRELIDAKIRGLPVKAKPVETPSPVVDLMGQIFGGSTSPGLQPSTTFGEQRATDQPIAMMCMNGVPSGSLPKPTLSRPLSRSDLL